jgi:transglutaminase/protease-like cytokinesis protein 3
MPVFLFYFFRYVFFFLFELGVSCIHHVYFGLHPSMLFLKYTILIKKKKKKKKSIKLNVKKTFVIFSSFSTLKLKIIKYAFSNILEKKARQELG